MLQIFRLHELLEPKNLEGLRSTVILKMHRIDNLKLFRVFVTLTIIIIIINETR